MFPLKTISDFGYRASQSVFENSNAFLTWTYGGMQFPKLSVPEHRVHNKESPEMNLCPHPVALNKQTNKSKKENKEQGEGDWKSQSSTYKISRGDVMYSTVDSSLLILYCIFASY